MALVSSLFTAITGMRNHQTMLDVISNNVANVNTYGFKSGRVMFRDLLSQTITGANAADPATGVGGMNPIQSGTGAAVASVDTLFTQGTLQTTGNVTDMAINGDGFFITKSGTTSLYTRAGAFRFDNVGNLVDASGAVVQGWTANVPSTDPLGKLVLDASDPSKIGNITIPTGTTLQASQTTQVTMTGNLDAGATAANLANATSDTQGWTDLTVYDYTPNAGLAPTENLYSYKVGVHTMTFNAYDSLGGVHKLTATLTNLSGTQIPYAPPNTNYDNNTWAWTVDTDPNDTTVHLALDNSTYTDPITGTQVRASSSGLIHFNTNGSLDWVAYADRNAEHFGTNASQTSANDPNIPGGNALPPAGNMPPTAGVTVLPEPPNDVPTAAPTANNDLWADVADMDPHNTTIIGFEGVSVPAGDFQGAADLSTAPFGQDTRTGLGAVLPPPADGTVDNEKFDNPGTPIMGWLPDALGGTSGQVTISALPPAQEQFDLSKLPIVLCYQQVPAGSPVPPTFSTPGTLVTDFDVAGLSAATGGLATTVQSWYVQSVGIDWGTVSTITQADFDRNMDMDQFAGNGIRDLSNETLASGSQAWPHGTGDGQMDGSHIDYSNPTGANVTVPGGSGASIGDRYASLEMPWDPRVVRTTLGLRDGVTQDVTGQWDASGTFYKPYYTASMSSDGYSEGVLQGVSVDTSGKVIGSFKTVQGDVKYQSLAQIAIANFANPAGLAKSGDTHWTPTANSGAPVVGTALSSGRGSVISGVLEQSNVDLSQELTNMIVAQRGFEVNARLVSTSDRILDTLVNLAR